MASLIVAYGLWLIGGFFGLHHLYLNRACHAFTWFCTGGGFLFGLLWDLCELPLYADECNHKTDYLLEHARKHPSSVRCSTVRFSGQIILGSLFGFVTVLAVPQQFLELTHLQQPLVSILISIGIALGVSWAVYIVGNIGLQHRPFLWCWLGAWPPVYVFIGLLQNYNGIVFAAIGSAILSNRNAIWRKRKSPFGVGHYLIWVLGYLSLWCIGLGYNVTLDINGESTPLGKVVYDVFNEGHFNQWIFEQTESEHHEHWQYSWRIFMENLRNRRKVALPTEINQAYKVLGISGDASQKTIHSRCRELLKSSHPDVSGSDTSDSFVKYRSACELLDWRAKTRHDEF